MCNCMEGYIENPDTLTCELIPPIERIIQENTTNINPDLNQKEN